MKGYDEPEILRYHLSQFGPISADAGHISCRLKVARRKDDTGWRIPADEFEVIVAQQLIVLLNSESRLAEWIEQYASRDAIVSGLNSASGLLDGSTESTALCRSIVKQAIVRITLGPENIEFEINLEALVRAILPSRSDAQFEARYAPPSAGSGKTHKVKIACRVRRRGNEARLIIGDRSQLDKIPDSGLVNLLARSHSMLTALTNGSARSISELSKVIGIHRADLSKALPLAFLSPAIVDDILSGKQPVNLTARRLARLTDLPANWDEQRAALGFSSPY